MRLYRLNFSPFGHLQATYIGFFMRPIFAFALILSTIFAYGQRSNPVIQEFEAEKLFYDGRTMYQHGDFNAAIAAFNRVLQANPDHPEVYELRAEAYFQLTNYHQAVKDYQAAIRLDPDNAELYNSAGVAAAQLSEYGLAIAYFEQALVVNPMHEAAQRNLAAAKQRYANNPTPSPNTPTGTPGRDPFDPGNLAPKMSLMELDAWAIGSNSTPRGSGGVGATRSQRDFDAEDNYTYTTRQKKVIIGGQSDPYVEIVRVITRKDETEISLIITNITNDEYPVMLDRLGDYAFYLTDQNLDKRFPLRQVVGMRRTGSSYVLELDPGEERAIALKFAPLDADMWTFHLLEGTEPREGAWNFWNITLKD